MLPNRSLYASGRLSLVALALLALLALQALQAMAASPSSPLRVGTSGDYAPFSDSGGGLHGFDRAVARAFAEEREQEIEFVTFRWPKLLRDLGAGRFDVAMSGITIRPERSAAGRFSLPVIETGAVLLVNEARTWRDASEANHKRIRIAVNAGGHLERVAHEHFPEAVLVVIPDNRAVLRALVDWKVEAVLTDSVEAPGWLRKAEGFRALGPFTRDRKAFLLAPDADALAADLDGWLLDREADGTLAKLRALHFGAKAAAAARIATPLRGLLASIDERLSLMPLIGLAKRREGYPLEVPEREKFVLDTAVANMRRSAEVNRVTPPPEDAVRAFFQAQMEAAKEVQWNAVRAATPGAETPLLSLDGSLRPALIRIGERINRLLLALPDELDPVAVSSAANEQLRSSHLSRPTRKRLADAITAFVAANASPEMAPSDGGSKAPASVTPFEPRRGSR